jgi:integrase/recombinase XerD
MNATKPTALACGLRDFFADHLPRLRGMSPHTVLNYRDCWVLLLRFVAAQKKRPVTKLDIDDLDAGTVITFLQMLEDERHNSVTTRNVRLAAIHVFFKYLAGRYPEKVELCQRVLAVPFKQARSRPVEYLEYVEIKAVLAAIDRSHGDGERDYILIVTMFNTGARVQEIIDMRWQDLQLIKPYQARLFGKGRKERLCPLWPQTAQLLQKLFTTQDSRQLNEHVFLNHRKQPLTRFGVRYLLAKYCDRAKENMPTLAGKRLHPHSMRHSTAVHLLKAGVDIVTISHWLGHASINTTNRYVSIDLDMKRKAIAKIALIDTSATSTALWRSKASILKWLESFHDGGVFFKEICRYFTLLKCQHKSNYVELHIIG